MVMMMHAIRIRAPKVWSLLVLFHLPRINYFSLLVFFYSYLCSSNKQ